MKGVTLSRAVRSVLPPPGDAELLGRFVAQADDGAFAELVRRHGPAVWGVCRRTLGAGHDAEDAFQATFLTLARKADTLRSPARLSGWLHGVALRVARKARYLRQRRRNIERPLADLDPCVTPPESDDRIDRELAALPAKWREPVLLCLVRGLSRAEAAGQLGIPEGTLSSRLARGKAMLKERLIRRGVAGSGLLGTGLARAVPPSLTSQTLRAILSPAAAPGAVALSNGVLTTMWIAKAKLAALVAAVVLLPLAGARLAGTSPVAPPAQESKALADPGEPVAVIFGDTELTRREFGEFLIERYGKEKLDLFVKQKILERAAAERGIRIGDEQIEATVRRTVRELDITRDQFVNHVAQNYGKSLFVWENDVLRPQLVLKELVRDRVDVTEGDLRKMFDRLHGEKVKVRVCRFTKDLAQVAERVVTRIRAGATDTAMSTRRPIVIPLADVGEPGDRFAQAVAALRPGEVTPVIDTPQGLTVVYCEERLPADASKKFADERDDLRERVIERKVALLIPEYFDQLREKADPKLLLK